MFLPTDLSMTLINPTSSSQPDLSLKKLRLTPLRRMTHVEQWSEPPNSKTERKGTGITSKPCSSNILTMAVSPSSTMIFSGLTLKTFMESQREDWQKTGCSFCSEYLGTSTNFQSFCLKSFTSSAH